MKCTSTRSTTWTDFKPAVSRQWLLVFFPHSNPQCEPESDRTLVSGANGACLPARLQTSILLLSSWEGPALSFLGSCWQCSGHSRKLPANHDYRDVEGKPVLWLGVPLYLIAGNLSRIVESIPSRGVQSTISTRPVAPDVAARSGARYFTWYRGARRGGPGGHASHRKSRAGRGRSLCL